MEVQSLSRHDPLVSDCTQDRTRHETRIHETLAISRHVVPRGRHVLGRVRRRTPPQCRRAITPLPHDVDGIARERSASRETQKAPRLSTGGFLVVLVVLTT